MSTANNTGGFCLQRQQRSELYTDIMSTAKRNTHLKSKHWGKKNAYLTSRRL